MRDGRIDADDQIEGLDQGSGVGEIVQCVRPVVDAYSIQWCPRLRGGLALLQRYQTKTGDGREGRVMLKSDGTPAIRRMGARLLRPWRASPDKADLPAGQCGQAIP